MPSSDHETTLARQWELVCKHLPSKPPGKSSLQLRDALANTGHDVNKRTIFIRAGQAWFAACRRVYRSFRQPWPWAFCPPSRKH
jgi:hypothetical protein